MTVTLTEITVTVTQEHIDRGRRRGCSDCPVALAILAAVPGLSGVDVMNPDLGYTLLFDGSGGASTLKLPQPACDFIYRFDAGLDVSPFTFAAEVES